MNRRLASVFVFALVVAALASMLVYRLLVGHLQTPVKAPPSNRLVVAAHDLQVGALIHDADIVEVNWTGTVPDQIEKTRDAVSGRGVIATIYKGEPISTGRLAAKGAGAGLAATIPIGMRAVALRVNDVVGLAGFVLPGMRVDVLVAGSAPELGPSGGTICKTVLQNIEVLSAGQKLEKNVEGKPEMAQVVNLLVTPDQAEILNLAGIETKVQLVLRNPLDTQQETTQGATVAGLFGVKPVVAALHVPAKPAFIPHAPAPNDDSPVEVFNGMKHSEARLGDKP
jgi:pilus assembly protein CpaB